MNSIEAWDNDDAKLIAEMTYFEANWKHKKPCKEYLKTRYCTHLEKAQSRKFKNRVEEHMTALSTHFKPISQSNQ
jgi:hypothetical protein